jgi:hypothetical protein
VAKVKVVNNNLDSNLNGDSFDNTASNVVFSFGSFSVTSNFDSKKFVDYSNTLSSFVYPITLETMNISDVQSELMQDKTTNAVLNLDKSDLNTFIRYGSAYEFLRITIENIILDYPASLFVSSKIKRSGNLTYSGFSYNELTNISIFNIPVDYIVNTYGIVINDGNSQLPDNNELRNLNISYDKFNIWSSLNPDLNSCSLLGFTGYTSSRRYVKVQVTGNPFPTISGSAGNVDFHIKPNTLVFEEFRAQLSDYEKYVISEREDNKGFKFTLKTPTLLDSGEIIYNDSLMFWNTNDGYNLDINTATYRNFLESILTIGMKYDQIKTDLIARFLTPASLRTYDLTAEGKMSKLLKIYGREFDQMREFIDSLVYINKVTYDKINNIPDQLVSNLAKTLGWNYFSLVNEGELVESFLTIDDKERNLHTDLMPAEIDIELWRRIIMNTNYFWKGKGTREALKSMFLLIGIPEPFINITEYVYTVDGIIDPRTVTLTELDFPSQSLPYDTSGYPVAPLETSDFYFQMSGDTDSGQAYLNVFRMVGFNLNQTVDNKKSWIQTGSTYRVDDTTSQYYQADSKLVINTKEIDVTLDTSSGIEYDVYDYVKTKDFTANSSGYTLPITYINLSLPVGGMNYNVFQLPTNYKEGAGELEVRLNGILLAAPKEYDTISGMQTVPGDYYISGSNLILNEYANNDGVNRDIVQITYIETGYTAVVAGLNLTYMVTRINATSIGTIIPLPNTASGDVQLTLNGIALTKGTNQFIGDYIVDPNNSNQIIIQNQEVIAYLAINPIIQVSYLNVVGGSSIGMRSEILRIDSFNTGKIYYNESANKYVYKLNYKINNIENVKILINGLALEPGTDYTLNSSNPYEIYLPNGLRYGTVLSAYYIVAGNDFFDPIISNDFGIGDISKLSFLEFIELIQRRMINATNRKTITDFKGGWYPTLLNIYITYLKRSTLPDDNPLHSNGYTFNNLYSFLSKYNSFFQKFVDQLLSATVIMRKGGLMVRNTVFTRQKFTYKRGVYMGIINTRNSDGLTTYKTDNNFLYHGDDGATYLKFPLTKVGAWSENPDDKICVSNLCENFVVNNVTVTYPITTTTTTMRPLTVVLTTKEIDSEAGDGLSEITYGISQEGLIPSYTALIYFDFSTLLYIASGSSGTTSTSKASIIITNNGISVYARDYSKYEISDDYLADDYIYETALIKMEVGDVIHIILRNEVVQEPGYPAGTVTSTTVGDIRAGITPNGNAILVPAQINNMVISTSTL